MTTAHTQGEWDLRVEFTKPGGMQREARIDELLPRLVPAGGSVITEHGESVMAGDIDRMIITDGDDEHPQGRRVFAGVNWQAGGTEMAANAKLLLAAPAMLDALRTAVDLLEQVDALQPLQDSPATEADVAEILGAIEAATL